MPGYYAGRAGREIVVAEQQPGSTNSSMEQISFFNGDGTRVTSKYLGPAQFTSNQVLELAVSHRS
jgi:hypothetical protein